MKHLRPRQFRVWSKVSLETDVISASDETFHFGAHARIRGQG